MTTADRRLERLLVAANGGVRPVNFTLPRIVDDVEALIANMVQKQNVKVGRVAGIVFCGIGALGNKEGLSIEVIKRNKK